ncbi:THxN family PEP-CTERM protein [Ottowia thiooxydans]|uniref:IPTL-CTERM protein sorting domain-containing protein n=1 Tax=Ottowia thiooxydans TaxID=219182 RepID=A0ABV2QEL8_9BURK
MRGLKKCMGAIGILLMAAVGSASAEIVNWEYSVQSQFNTSSGATQFIGVGPGTADGCESVASSLISWGACPVGSANRSSIGVSDTPQSGTLATNGAAEVANTYTHFNRVISSVNAKLSSAVISITLALKPAGSSDPFSYFSFESQIKFFETLNSTADGPCVVADGALPCSDIWVVENSLNRNFVYEGLEYVVNFFPGAVLSPLPDEVCAAVSAPTNCLGFTTAEQINDAMRFYMNVTYAPPLVTVAGRVYVEGSSPANTQDDGNTVDPGSVTQVSLTCTDPTYSAGPITTGADGSYSFSEVPAGANCSLTTTPPSGYQAAYTQQGTTGESGTPGTLNTGVAGSTGVQTIAISVPMNGSTGSLFALRPMTDMTSATVCTPNPAAAGTAVSCTTTCTNAGSSTALNAFCSIPNASGLPGAPVPACSAGVSDLTSGGTITCTVNFTMPQSGSISVTGGTGADNDSNGGSVPSAGNNPSITAVTRPGEGQVSTPTPVPGLGGFALLLLPVLMGLGAFRQHRRRSDGGTD